MKRLSFKIAVAAILFVVGTISLSAQIGRGGTCLNTGISNVVDRTCTILLTAEQQDILDALFVEFQA